MTPLTLGLIALIFTAFGVMTPEIFAHPHHQITVNQINDEIALETVTTTMIVPNNTDLKWATIKGTVSDPVDWYPVIIQLYKNDEPVRFAQIDLKGDNSYEYQFQIRDYVDNSILNIFDGRYTVKISAVVYHNPHMD